MPVNYITHPSSYRDPSGFIFYKEDILYRQVNKSYQTHFDFLISSGCYDALIKKGMLIPHQIIDENITGDNDWYTTLKPGLIPYISYAYEWSFDMLKDAAILTLNILKTAIEHGMILKDATPYNIQWKNGQPIFIDSLSFEKYDETKPWIAYRQFCECFLSPLLIARHCKMPVQELLLAYSEGIPLPLTKSILPWTSRFSLHTYLHIHLNAKYSTGQSVSVNKTASFSKTKMLNLISSLEGLITKTNLPAGSSTWSHYYEEAAQRTDYLEKKQHIIQQWIEKAGPLHIAADFGANTGEFSQLLSKKNITTIAADFDANCINALYKEIKKTGEKNILPLIVDLSKPSPAIGVNNTERDSFISRTRVDLALALALIHHLAIGKNIPFEKIADLFQQMCNQLIIEFVPKHDEKVKLMLQQKEDIYTAYNEEEFIRAFEIYFSIADKQTIPGSGRTLFLMKKK